jgi:hypothetical protein
MRVTVIILLFIMLLASLAAASDETANQPVLYMDRLVSDLGEIFEQPNYIFTFKVENRGKADLLIENVKPG